MPLSSKERIAAAIIAVLFLIVIILVSSFGSSDLDTLCREGEYLKRINGIWTCNEIYYAEGYHHSYDTPITITLIDGEYQNITGFMIERIRGFTNISTYGVIVSKTAVYKLNAQLSFRGGNSGQYEVELNKNGISQHNCAFFRSTSTVAIGNAIASCIIDLKAGDILFMQIKDIAAPFQDALINQLNFNIVEI